MTIVNFTPFHSLIGGLFIGLASSLMLLSMGKVFGISGIIGGILRPKKGDFLWRILIVAGLIIGALCANFLLNSPPSIQTVPLPYLIIGGLFMGFGTRLGSGCTSGHGVCGISRLSGRSIVATLTFMMTGFITVFLFNF